MPTSFTKRNREKTRQEKQRDKAAKREQRKAERQNRPAAAPGEDPDIAGIVPGPQPALDDDMDESRAAAPSSE